MKTVRTLSISAAVATTLLAGVVPSAQAAAPPLTPIVTPQSYGVMGVYPTVRACVTAAETRFPTQSYWSCRQQKNGKWYLYANDGRTD